LCCCRPYLAFDHEVSPTHIHVMLLWVVVPSVMLSEEDNLWGQASGDAAIHLIACQHELFSDFKIIGVVLAASVDSMEMPQSQQPCSAGPVKQLVLSSYVLPLCFRERHPTLFYLWSNDHRAKTKPVLGCRISRRHQWVIYHHKQEAPPLGYMPAQLSRQVMSTRLPHLAGNRQGGPFWVQAAPCGVSSQRCRSSPQAQGWCAAAADPSHLSLPVCTACTTELALRWLTPVTCYQKPKVETP